MPARNVISIEARISFLPGIFESSSTPADVEDLALVVAALDLELGLVLGPLQRDRRRRLRSLAGRPDDGGGADSSAAVIGSILEPFTAILTSEFLRTR